MTGHTNKKGELQFAFFIIIDRGSNEYLFLFEHLLLKFLSLFRRRFHQLFEQDQRVSRFYIR